MVELGFELESVLLEGLLWDTVYAILSILRKAHFSNGLHITKLTIQQRKLIIGFDSIKSFINSWKNQVHVGKVGEAFGTTSLGEDSGSY